MNYTWHVYDAPQADSSLEDSSARKLDKKNNGATPSRT